MKVLLVEDSDADAELITRQLARSHPGCRIHRVQTEPQFLLALHEVKPDLVLSDYSLPEFNGLRALELTLAHAAETPFILVSGTVREHGASEALSRGANEFVPKSALAGLPAAVDRAIGSGAGRAAASLPPH